MDARFGISRRRLTLSFPSLIGFLLHPLLFAGAPRVALIVDEMCFSRARLGLIFSAFPVGLILFRIPRKIQIHSG